MGEGRDRGAMPEDGWRMTEKKGNPRTYVRGYAEGSLWGCI